MGTKMTFTPADIIRLRGISVESSLKDDFDAYREVIAERDTARNDAVFWKSIAQCNCELFEEAVQRLTIEVRQHARAERRFVFAAIAAAALGLVAFVLWVTR